ncbi:MAG: hypothetical protein LBD16_01240 [Oscillospiraceae bacterium]|jgi:hypothetical protein|nr:hypothetical protein [Oscillospiraceae bacterium]
MKNTTAENPIPFNMESALVGIAASVAMQEASIANLINMETKKLQYLFCMDYGSDEEKAASMLEANASVAKTIEAAGKIERSMAIKLHMTLETHNRISSGARTKVA